MKKLNQIFFKGLIVVLPITLTFYLLYWASINVESIFGPMLARVLGDWLYVPGLGILLSLIFIMLVGVLVSNYITARFFTWITGLLEKVPLIKAIYSPLRDLMGLIPGKSSDGSKLQRVVLVPLEPMGVKVLGLVTREDLDELPGKNLISVYIPLSYMLGGVTVLIEPSKVEKVDMPVDVALKLSVTSWIKAKADN
ncbi:MAG: DUF502 domain-containing protein [Bdellovibrionota bacterium]